MVSLAPSPKTTLVVLLGASAWPRCPELEASKAFLNSYIDLRDYLLDPNGFDLPKDHLLDLFDSDDYTDQLDDEISLFLKSHIAEKETGDVRDVLVYFIGHGEISAGTSDLYLAIRRTRQDNPRGSSIGIDNLAQTLKEQACFQRRFLVLDCCFAASAVSHFQGSNLTGFMTAKTAEAFAERGKGDGFPSKGTALLCSSRNTVRSRILPDETATMFTQALLHTLRVGTPYQKENLSLYMVHHLTEDYLRQMYHDKAPRPEVHSPDQSEGDVADIPFFPNPSMLEERARPAEGERRRLAQHSYSASGVYLMPSSPQSRATVFICYSHKDKKYLDVLQQHLDFYKQQGLIDFWDDTRTVPGAQWHREIEQAIKTAKVAVLLISIDFLTSKFITEEELPPLLAAAEGEGVKILPVLLRPSDFHVSPLSRFQAVDAVPYTEKKGAEREKYMVKVARAIKEAAGSQSSHMTVPGSPQVENQATATADAKASMTMTTAEVIDYPSYLPGNGTLALFDPLNDKSTSKWGTGTNSSGGNCRLFTNGAYSVSQSSQADYIMNCQTIGIFSNFVFEVQMKVILGNSGGVIFRNSGPFYLFSISQDGSYMVEIGGITNGKILLSGLSSAINTGQKQTNKIAVVANGATLTFFANEQQIGQVQDGSYAEGMIGLIAYPGTEAAYNNAKIWTL
jgi:hypothetical protein